MPAVAAALPSRERVTSALKHRFFLRLHMFVMLGGTFAAGLATTKVLLEAHVRNMAFRYGLAVAMAFLVFIGLIRLWLAYVAWLATRAGRRSSSSGDADWFDCVNFLGDGVSEGGELPSFGGGGGKFGGGGASGSWGDSAEVAPQQAAMIVPPPPRASGGGGGGGKGFGGIDLGDEFGIVVLVILLAVVIAVAALYVIYAAPAILSEAAFNAALAAALHRHAKKVGCDGWVGGVFRATVLPFLCVMAVAIALGWYAQKQCPAAVRLSEAMHCVK